MVSLGLSTSRKADAALWSARPDAKTCVDEQESVQCETSRHWLETAVPEFSRRNRGDLGDGWSLGDRGQLIGEQQAVPVPFGGYKGDTVRPSVLAPALYFLTCPLPRTMYLYVVNSSSAMGPRAWSRLVLMPISAPKPNSPPSLKRVEAFQNTADESTWRKKS
jgi:hypothetical protein